MVETSVWNNVPEATQLRDLIDDLCSRLEKAGVNDTNLAPVYVRMDLRSIRAKATDLIEDVFDAGYTLEVGREETSF